MTEELFGAVVERAPSRWTSLVSMFGRRKARSHEATYRLTMAYVRVFRGQPSREDQEVVLADLLAQSGFSRVSSSAVSADDLRQREGMRELFSHIHRHLSLAPDDLLALENAARLESAVDNP